MIINRTHWFVICLIFLSCCGAQGVLASDSEELSCDKMKELEEFVGSDGGLEAFEKLGVSDEELMTMIMPLAEAGDPEAMVFIGVCYMIGRQVPQDIEKAGEWYKKAAALGFEPASLMLVSLLAWDGYRDFDVDKAVKVVEKLAVGRNPDALVVLGKYTYRENMIQKICLR